MTTIYNFDPETYEFLNASPAPTVTVDIEGELVEKELTEGAWSTLIAPPEVKDGYTCRWTGTKWEQLEDHRQHTDNTGVKVGGTPYWLPGDPYRTPPRYMEELGPLPEDAVFEAPKQPVEELWAFLRSIRDSKLNATDFYFMADYEVSEEVIEKVKVYRQALRDITELEGAPWDGGGPETPWPVLSL